MAENLERAAAPRIRENHPAIRRALDEAELREALRHRRDRRRAHAHARRERGRRHALALGLDGVDRLQVVLDGDGELGRLGFRGHRLRVHSVSDLDMAKLSRRKLLAAAAPLAAAPIVGKLALDGSAEASGHDHSSHSHTRTPATHSPSALGHAAMIGDEVPAVGGPRDLDALLYPPKALAYKPGRVREYELVA